MNGTNIAILINFQYFLLLETCTTRTMHTKFNKHSKKYIFFSIKQVNTISSNEKCTRYIEISHTFYPQFFCTLFGITLHNILTSVHHNFYHEKRKLIGIMI